ncbi:4-hydroxy-2-oxovalerate aldolase [Mycetocola manganoxydans]|uniref:4-hydroxy-2-oxovalerate aldolase n=1 Tax=Mycetocola manganoxydans TaxID=699879 RepID=A0A3L6ZTV4_9MICO|nr:aldolase/citrate lyase family protein [Mycetocola manganoxydans]RLP71423.1 4-hydroxy-2-oxovalerate aldolase [Mycetocola manganoxydans]GHD46419.1 4-hydroxy-2-oxovalerate aldolase [Mycetocola manganoxydans]
MSYGSLQSRENTEGERSLRSEITGRALVGTFQIIGSPTVTEVLALSGADIIVPDAEHAAFDLPILEQLVRAGDVRGASVVIRVPGLGNDLSRALDTGAAGVIVPRVESAADAEAIVRATRFPPVGARGIGPARGTSYGLDIPTYRERANDDLLVVAMVETRAGLDAVDDIVAVDGIDVILIGPADLASSLGSPIGSTEHTDAVSRILDTALAAGRQVGIHCADAESAAAYRDRGMHMLLIGTDVSFLSSAAVADLRGLPGDHTSA